MALPKLAIGALGGTVSMQSRGVGQGVMPSLNGAAMLQQLPELTALAEVQVHTLCLMPSASLSFTQLLEALKWAKTCIGEGAQGVVLTQGTDTLEETAYFLDLLWDLDAPLVLTGAMRAASQYGADGPANLLSAAQVALTADSHHRGVLVVMNDQVHAAARVRKSAALAMDAFTSPPFGPLGVMVEGQVHYCAAPSSRASLPYPLHVHHQVALLEATLDADTGLLDHVIAAGYRGLVVAGFGAGHVSQTWAHSIANIAARIPVVVASRTGSGHTASHTYGFIGGEMDLQKKGVTMAGGLCPRKARILLWLLIGSDQQHDRQRYFGANTSTTGTLPAVAATIGHPFR